MKYDKRETRDLTLSCDKNMERVYISPEDARVHWHEDGAECNGTLLPKTQERRRAQKAFKPDVVPVSDRVPFFVQPMLAHRLIELIASGIPEDVVKDLIRMGHEKREWTNEFNARVNKVCRLE